MEALRDVHQVQEEMTEPSRIEKEATELLPAGPVFSGVPVRCLSRETYSRGLFVVPRVREAAPFLSSA